MTGVVVVVLIPAALTGLYIHATGKNHEHLRYPDEDITVMSCRRDPSTGLPTARVRVTSRAARTGTYRVTIAFTATSGTPAGRTTTLFKNVAPAQSLTRQANGPQRTPGPPACTVTDTTFAASSGRPAPPTSPAPTAGVE